MGRRWSALAMMVLAALAIAALAHAAEAPTREAYAAQVEPICQANTTTNEHILAPARAEVKHKELARAGGRFLRAASAFGEATSEIAAVPRPPADEARLANWVRRLRLVQSLLRKTGVALKRGDRLQATYEVIKLRHAGNSANNIASPFEFNYCRLRASTFG